MKNSIPISIQIKKLLTIFLLVYLPIVILLIILSIQTYVPFSHLTIDPILLIEGGKPYYGFISYFGVLLLCITSVVCIYTSIILRNFYNESEWMWFVLYAGLTSAVLMFDDLFMFHEYLPNYLPINEKIIFSLYGLVIIIFLIRFRKTILNKTNYFLLFLTFIFYALSIITDVLQDDKAAYHYTLEDGFKLLGTVSWFIYFAGTSLKSITYFHKKALK